MYDIFFTVKFAFIVHMSLSFEGLNLMVWYCLDWCFAIIKFHFFRFSVEIIVLTHFVDKHVIIFLIMAVRGGGPMKGHEYKYSFKISYLASHVRLPDISSAVGVYSPRAGGAGFLPDPFCNGGRGLCTLNLASSIPVRKAFLIYQHAIPDCRPQ